MQKNFTLNLRGKEYQIEITEKPRAHIEVQVNAHRFEFPPRGIRNVVKKAIKRYPLDKTNPRGSAVTSPLPGTISSIKVSPESRVREGDVLAIILSMKMENEIKAPVDAKVTQILVHERQNVKKDEPLFVLES